MRKLIRPLALFAPIFGVMMYIGFSGSPVNAADTTKTEVEDPYDNEVFPRDLKYLFPPPVPVFSNPDRKFMTKIEDDTYYQEKYGLSKEESEAIGENNTERVAYGAVDTSEELQQPVHYSHMLHAGKLQIECQYCHTYARRSIHAGIPASQICMNCHSENKVKIEGRKEKAQADIKYLWNKFNEKEEIPWVKVHDLPDFVYFPHKRHVKAGVLCQECHGEVQDDMTVARRMGELTMGWCLNCHEDHPSISENYCSEEELKASGSCESEQLRRAEIKDCWNCHK